MDMLVREATEGRHREGEKRGEADQPDQKDKLVGRGIRRLQ